MSENVSRELEIMIRADSHSRSSRTLLVVHRSILLYMFDQIRSELSFLRIVSSHRMNYVHVVVMWKISKHERLRFNALFPFPSLPMPKISIAVRSNRQGVSSEVKIRKSYPLNKNSSFASQRAFCKMTRVSVVGNVE
jgi:hypothetical protein